jgi:hypothetical protein
MRASNQLQQLIARREQLTLVLSDAQDPHPLPPATG